MKSILNFLVVTFLMLKNFSLNSIYQIKQTNIIKKLFYSTTSTSKFSKMSLPDNFDKQQPDSYWKDKLSKYEFDVLRNKATEPPRYSESTPGALEYELKKEYGTKYPKGGKNFSIYLLIYILFNLS